MEADLLERLEMALTATREAGQLTLDYFRASDLGVERKPDESPVTIADRRAELHLRDVLRAAFPHDAILGEEHGELEGTSGYRWILDPIDGTKSFISGVPLYTTLVGLERDGTSLLGVIRAPALDEMVYAARGHGAWHQLRHEPPVPARVSARAPLGAGLFCTSEVRTFARRGRLEAYLRLEAASRLARTWGDGYGYLLVATGRAEAMVDPAMHVWDCAALQPVLEEAGGTFTDWRGERTIHAGEAVATNGRVLDEVLEVTRQYPAQGGV